MDCIFCKIAAGGRESETHIFENEHFSAFLDIRPLSPGHTLIVPKKHFRWVWDLPNVGDYFEVARIVAQALQKTFSVDAVHARIVGEEVPHAHISVYPDPDTAKGDKNDLIGNAKKIREAIGS